MARVRSYVGEAIAHEAGHILLGKEFGIQVDQLDVVLTRTERGIAVGDFATVAESPTNDEITVMSNEEKMIFKLFLAGGVAGNKFDGLLEITPGAESDRQELIRFTDESLEDLSDAAMSTIHERRRIFRRLVSATHQRLRELLKNGNLQSGKYTLLTAQEIEAIFNQK